MTPSEVIERIASAAAAIGWQAGVGGMETAGSLISYLAKHPEKIDDFLAGRACVLDWPTNWHREGLLTWHAQDGSVCSPAKARRAAVIRKLERGEAA